MMAILSCLGSDFRHIKLPELCVPKLHFYRKRCSHQRLNPSNEQSSLSFRKSEDKQDKGNSNFIPKFDFVSFAVLSS